MPTYFKPLRRKIGVVTLTALLVFIFWWVRSQSTSDVIVVPSFQSRVNIFVSHDNAIVWMRSLQPKVHQIYYAIQPSDELDGILNHVFNGFGPSYEPVIFIPYWSIIISLTFLSAILLLARPTNRLKKSTEPVLGEGS